MQQVTVRVPASTSNLGPGFDCLGLALRIYNQVTVRLARRARVAPMVQAAANSFYEHADVERRPFACKIDGDVPRARGLGSSVTVRLGVLHGLNELTGRPLSREQIYRICTDLEGHPDNAAPSEFGGFNVVSCNARQRFTVSAALKVVLFVPAFEVSTAKARALLPPHVEHGRAAETCGHACAIVAAFASGDHEQLRGHFNDALHQPYRKPLVPFFDEVVAAAESSGALGAFLSGSGSTIAAVTLRNAREIGAAMFAAAGRTGRVVITSADNRGTRVLSSRS